uniref:Ig-like domain-containing protein n=1 Tax=Varanus komodoensis TaxID=61221 RepID=A0A8D2JBQ8_VARKO
MSIDIDSISGDEAAEPERFYTPPSSVENFESPLSFMPPRFTSPVADIEVPEKSEALFHCKVAGRPTPVVQWFKESKCIAPDAWKYDIFSENGSHSLKIQNVGHSDSGMYLCKAVNTVGEATCKCILAVTKCQRAEGGSENYAWSL